MKSVFDEKIGCNAYRSHFPVRILEIKTYHEKGFIFNINTETSRITFSLGAMLSFLNIFKPCPLKPLKKWMHLPLNNLLTVTQNARVSVYLVFLQYLWNRNFPRPLKFTHLITFGYLKILLNPSSTNEEKRNCNFEQELQTIE
jgi:hypothetical protein